MFLTQFFFYWWVKIFFSNNFQLYNNLSFIICTKKFFIYWFSVIDEDILNVFFSFMNVYTYINIVKRVVSIWRIVKVYYTANDICMNNLGGNNLHPQNYRGSLSNSNIIIVYCFNKMCSKVRFAHFNDRVCSVSLLYCYCMIHNFDCRIRSLSCLLNTPFCTCCVKKFDNYKSIYKKIVKHVV